MQQQQSWLGSTGSRALPFQQYSRTAIQQHWSLHHQQQLNQPEDALSNQVQQILATVEQQQQQFLTLTAANQTPQSSMWVQANAQTGPAAALAANYDVPVAVVSNGKVLLGPGVMQPAVAQHQHQLALHHQQQQPPQQQHHQLALQHQQQQQCLFSVASEGGTSESMSPLAGHLEAIMGDPMYLVSCCTDGN
jgi:hypothetical protein